MLIDAIIRNLEDLRSLLTHLEDSEYSEPMEVLSGSSIGEHTRHILEFYTCVIFSLDSGVVCYDKRKRDKMIEVNRFFAKAVAEAVASELWGEINDKPMELAANYDYYPDNGITASTSLYRELAYCLDHSIHHQALIKVAVRNLGRESILNDTFGIAPSTIRFRNGDGTIVRMQ